MSEPIKDGRFSYSHDSEVYTGDFDSVEDAIAEGLSGCEEGECFYVGRNRSPSPEQYVDADTIIDAIINSDAFCLECAEGWPGTTKEQEADLTESLRKLVADWVCKHNLEPDFFVIDDAQVFVVRDGAAVEEVKP